MPAKAELWTRGREPKTPSRVSRMGGTCCGADVNCTDLGVSSHVAKVTSSQGRIRSLRARPAPARSMCGCQEQVPEDAVDSPKARDRLAIRCLHLRLHRPPAEWKALTLSSLRRCSRRASRTLNGSLVMSQQVHCPAKVIIRMQACANFSLRPVASLCGGLCPTTTRQTES